MSKHTNIPAFPTTNLSGPQGMTLLDYFAGQVIGNLVEVDWLDDLKMSPQEISEKAYTVAEAMLSEREKRMKASDKTWQEEH